MAASLHSTEPVQERAARQINAYALLPYPSVPPEVTPALPALHNRPESWRGTAISESRQTATGARAAPTTLLHPLVLQGTGRAGSISALFASVNCSVQEQFLLTVCLDDSQKQSLLKLDGNQRSLDQGLAKRATKPPSQSLQRRVALQKMTTLKGKPFWSTSRAVREHRASRDSLLCSTPQGRGTASRGASPLLLSATPLFQRAWCF